VIRFLHDPTMGVVEFCFGITFVGFVGLWLIVANFVRGRRAGLNTSAVSQAEINRTYHPDDGIEGPTEEEDAEAEIVMPKPAYAEDRSRLTPMMLCIAFACLVSVVAGSWLTYTNYTILQCWTNGEDLFTRHDFAGAERLYRKAVRLNPQIRKSHLLLAKALMDGSNPVLALPELRIASQGEINDPTAPMLLGDELKALSQLPEAVQAYRQAIAIAPRNTILYDHLGMCLALLKRSDDAIKELRYAILLDPKNGMAKGTLGELLVAGGDKQEGLSLLKQAVELAPEDVTTHNNLGCGYAHEKRYTEAVAEFRAGLALDPYFAVAYYNLGCALRDLGDSRGAISAYEACISTCIKRPEFRGAAFSAEIELQKLKRARLLIDWPSGAGR
jgi:tetratricopeptide (TPR) repeat protein